MKVTRFDYYPIQATKTDEGFLVDAPVIARIGIQEYRRPDGSTQRELRLPDEVFKADSLQSYKGKPITVDHPSSGKVTSESAHRVTIGTILSEGKQDGDFVRSEIVIHSPDAIGERRQLSAGYECELEFTPGEWNGQRYDAIQRNIKVNHLSVVKSARAGAIARLNLDSNEEVEEVVINPKMEQTKMSTVKLKLDNGIEYDVAPEVSAALNKLRVDASEAAASKAKAEGERDTLQARVDAFPDELKKARDEGRTDAETRVKLEGVAGAFKVDCAGKSNREVKEAVIKAVRGDSADLKEKSDVYVDAAFDMAVEMRGDAAMAGQRQAAAGGAAGAQNNGGGYVPASQRYANRMDSLGKTEGA